MNRSIAELFRDNEGLGKFREEIVRLRGNFSFEREDMLNLGSAYFERYPDCFSNRDCLDVALGYRLVRTCVIEKLIQGMEDYAAGIFREMFYDLSLIEEKCKVLTGTIGTDRFMGILGGMEAKLKEIQELIDGIPTGMIKERFVGGISHIYNIMYLFKMSVEKNR